MAEMKLAHEQQLAAAVEKERQLAAEKQVEIERIKQQHQAELMRAQDDLKRQPLIQIPPSTLPPLSQNPFTIITPQPVIPRLDRGIQSVDEKALIQLLQYVAEGEQDKAEALIQKDKNLLLYAGTITDLSGREFKQITAFQYALWAMDWHMWTMIQKYLPKEAQAQQFQALESKGTMHGKHFNLQGLTGALQTYVDNAEKVWKYDQRADDHWCKVVGREQKLLPVHVVNEYCRPDRAFEPCPSEWEAKLVRTRELEIWDRVQSKYVKGSWFIPSSSKDDLGLTYAFYRCNYVVPDLGTWVVGEGWQTSKLSNPCGKHARSN